MTSYAFAAGAFGASAAVASKLTVDGSGLPRLLCTWLLSVLGNHPFPNPPIDKN